MSQSRSQRPRKSPRGAGWEALEDRRLLNASPAGFYAAQGRAMLLAQRHAAQVLRLQAAQANRAALAAQQAGLYTPAPSDGTVAPPSASPLQPTTPGAGFVTVPENQMIGRPAAAPTPSSLLGSAPLAARPIAFHPHISSRTFAPVTYISGTPSTPAPSDGTTPTTPSAPVPAGTTATGSGTSSSSSVSAWGSTPAPTPPSATAPTLVAPSTVTPAPVPWTGWLDGLTLSHDDVSDLKSAADALASAYTGGKDASADAAALKAFKSAVDDVALGIWSENHVAAKSDVAALQTAVNAFAANYTSNATPAQDRAAWKALGAAVKTFAGSLTNPHAASLAPSAAPATPAAWPGPGRGPGADDLIGGLLGGQAPTTEDVSALKAAADDLASGYTFGANPAADKAAVDTFRNAVADLSFRHWQAGTQVARPPVTPGALVTTTNPGPTWPTTPTPPATVTTTAATPVRGLTTVQASTTPAANPGGAPTGKG